MPIPGYPNATHYSPHFSRAEMNCHCGCKPSAEVEANLAVTAEHLEELRHNAGGYPLTVDDAHRCPTENTRVGGAKKSQHLVGKAADVTQAQHTPEQLAGLAATVPAYRNGGIGTYHSQGFVHVDWRGYTARWSEA